MFLNLILQFDHFKDICNMGVSMRTTSHTLPIHHSYSLVGVPPKLKYLFIFYNEPILLAHHKKPRTLKAPHSSAWCVEWEVVFSPSPTYVDD